MTPRQSRVSRPSTSYSPVPTLEHDGIAVTLQEALGARVVLIRVIGEGGMGRVYLGRDPQLKRFVAVKVLVQAGADQEAHARFQREAQAIAAISHPNVVSIYGVGDLPDGTPYFVMQYVSGGSMWDRIRYSGPLSIEMAEEVIADVAAALAAAHKRGIVHRDVKPANVLWDEDSERATVSDFGIAGLLSDEEGDIHITAGGMALGSPAYMSPEQLLAEPMTPKSDIYALGLLGYELLTGRGPYLGDTPAAVAAAHMSDQPRRLSGVRRDVPPALEDLLLRCLAKDAADRPTADEVVAALTPGAADALEWPPPGLERSLGALWRLMTMPALGTLCLLVPLLLMLVMGDVGGLQGTVVWPILLGASVVLAFSAFIGTAWRGSRIAKVIDNAARLRYGWGTVLEVMVDRRGDTGSLIAGTREYSGLSPQERSTFRALRVARATLLFIAPPLALLVAFASLVLRGSALSGADTLVWGVLLTMIGLAVLAVLASVPEQLRLRATRRKRSEHQLHRSDLELAPAWYAAFERSRGGQALGSGMPVRRVATIVATTVAAAAVLVCATVMLCVGLLTFTAQSMDRAAGNTVSSWLMFAAQRNWAARSYRVPADTGVSPTDAGEALLNIAATVQARSPSPIERPPRVTYAHWKRVVPPTAMFPKSGNQYWTDGAIVAAGKGLSPAQRELLERAAANPVRDELARVSRASSADVYGALLRLPLTEPLHPSHYPTDVMAGLDEAMESRAAAVALAVADHRNADAERGAREMIAVSSIVADMPFNINVLRGYALLQRALHTLEAVYIATGRERDARVLMDSVAAGARGVDQFPDANNVQHYERLMRSDQLMRGVRMEMLLPIASSACADPRQMLFGPSETTERDIAYVRDSLSRFPSERVWVESISQMMKGEIDATPEALREAGAWRLVPKMVDAVVGGHRFVNCLLYSPVAGREGFL